MQLQGTTSMSVLHQTSMLRVLQESWVHAGEERSCRQTMRTAAASSEYETNHFLVSLIILSK